MIDRDVGNEDDKPLSFVLIPVNQGTKMVGLVFGRTAFFDPAECFGRRVFEECAELGVKEDLLWQ